VDDQTRRLVACFRRVEREDENDNKQTMPYMRPFHNRLSECLGKINWFISIPPLPSPESTIELN
jgi:hypothetical protein